MTKALWLAVGLAVGFVAAQRISRTPQGQHLRSALDARAREFGKTVADAYKARQAELRDAIGSDFSDSRH